MLQIKVSTWQYDALCRQHSSNLFFPPATFEKKEDREKREAKAKAVCSGCPVKIECLEEANEISEPFGVQNTCFPTILEAVLASKILNFGGD